MKKKQVLMVMPHMIGGGAERVAAQLMNKINESGYETRFILTSSKKNEVVRSDLNRKTELILLTKELKKESVVQRLIHFPQRVYSTIFGKYFEKKNKLVPASVGKATIEWQYYREIKWMRNYLQQYPEMSVIVFLQPAIPIVLLAAKNLPNRIIISERADPNRLMKKRYGRKFIEKYYTRADAVVFQTEDAKKVYPDRVAEKGIVISNPLKPGLPDPYHGERNKNITTFCRISPDKDLINLLRAFELLHNDYSDYKLRIIGNASGLSEERLLHELQQYVANHNLADFVRFLPFMENVHQEIIKDAMYVNSSYTEGLCNAMLEAMAVGMPVVCTDCPVGGARATIQDGVNGLLVPVKDSKALYQAMKRIIEDKSLSEALSYHAAELKENLSLNHISDQWMELV